MRIGIVLNLADTHSRAGRAAQVREACLDAAGPPVDR
jgi:hypothetical protein